jgi:hypothetical protein
LNVGERCFKYSGDDNPRPSKIQKLNWNLWYYVSK